MCIYGVAQIGEGSSGSARFLPTLVGILHWMKPLLVFATGVWFILYIANRQTQSGVLISRVLAALVICGVIAVVDSGVELAYLTIPKKEESLATGCCPIAFDDRVEGQLVSDPTSRPVLEAAYFVACLGMTFALLLFSRQMRPSRLGLMALMIAAALTFIVGRTFLTEVAAPSILHLPYHHCPYDLIGGASETLVGISLFAWGTLSVGWAFAAGWFGRCSETDAFLPAMIGWIAFMAFSSYLSAAVMAAVELSLV
jgi:hypothetical protein